jgi:pimeloyl-ACP methyl ester carboxylesterase
LAGSSTNRVEPLGLRQLLVGLRPVRGERRRLLDAVSAPPIEPLPGRTVNVPDRGEFFVRDSGGPGSVVLLLHGWMVSADLNWLRTYGELVSAGYRVVAVDHRGHGRGLRSAAPFRLADCADDAAAVVTTLGCEPVIAVGYSMGGPIAQLLARRHPDLLSGMVLCATSREWQHPDFRRLWRTMWLIRLLISLAPIGFWTTGLRIGGLGVQGSTGWLIAELSRGAPAALAEAGRELGRFDSRPWLSDVHVPAAVVVTTADGSVPPSLQRGLAEQLRAPMFDVDADHLAPGLPDGRFNVGLLRALAHLAPSGVQRLTTQDA